MTLVTLIIISWIPPNPCTYKLSTATPFGFQDTDTNHEVPTPHSFQYTAWTRSFSHSPSCNTMHIHFRNIFSDILLITLEQVNQLFDI